MIILSSKLSELSQKEQDGFGETELEVMYSQIDQTFENSKMTASVSEFDTLIHH